jgi:hypothetical protein
MVVVSLFSICIMREEGNHVFVGLIVEVMHLVPLVQDVCHDFRWRCVYNGGADDVWHVSVILVLGDVQLLVGVKLSYCGEMDVTTQDCDAD